MCLCCGTELSNCSHFKHLVPKSLVLVVVNMGRGKILPFYCVCYSLTNSRVLQYAMMCLEVVPLLGRSVNSYFVFSLCQSQCRYQATRWKTYQHSWQLAVSRVETGKTITLMLISHGSACHEGRIYGILWGHNLAQCGTEWTLGCWAFWRGDI